MGRFIASDQVRSDAEIKAVIEGDATLDLDAAATIDGVQIASTDDVRTDVEIVAAVEASATLDLDAGATIGGSGIVSDADLALVALDDLADVSASSPSDQDVLTWDDGTSTWVAQAAAGGGGYDGDVSTSIELTRTTAVSTGNHSIVIGNGAEGLASDSVVLGRNAKTASFAAPSYAVVIGESAYVGQNCLQGIAIGRLAMIANNANSSPSVCIGGGTDVYGTYNWGTAIGYAAQCQSIGVLTGSVALGSSTYATGNNSTAIGFGADATQTNALALGANAQATGDGSISIRGTASATSGIAIGGDSSATATEALALGADADATAADAVAIGPDAKANRISSIVLSATGADSSPLTRDSTRVNGLYHVVNLRASSPDATPVEATSDGAAASTTDDQDRNVVVLTDGKVASFRLHMTAIQATTNDAAVYIVTGGVKCLAGTASIIGANTTTAYEDDASWDCTVTCTSNRLVVTCTADAGGASTWRGTLTLTYED